MKLFWAALIGVAVIVAGVALSSIHSGPDNWKPETVDMAQHITSFHKFPIGPQPNASLQVLMEPDGVRVYFQPDILEKLGGDRLLKTLGLRSNPDTISRGDYLFLLDNLHEDLMLYEVQNRIHRLHEP